LALNFRSYSKEHMFYGLGLSAPCPTPNLKHQNIPLCLGHHFDLSGMIPYQFLHYHQHSSQDHLTMHVPPLHQSREGNSYLQEYVTIWLCNVCNTASTPRKCIVIHNDVIWVLTTTMIFIQISMCLISPTWPKS